MVSIGFLGQILSLSTGAVSMLSDDGLTALVFFCFSWIMGEFSFSPASAGARFSGRSHSVAA